MSSTAKRAPRYLSLFPLSDRFCEHGNEVKQRSILDISSSCKRCKSPEEGFYFHCGGVWYHLECQDLSKKKTSQKMK